jgi:rubrerythrin
MHEEIDLDAIESNKDEAPDYRPMLKSGGPGAPADINYRMRYLSTLESEEKASYAEFARIADKEGMRKIAGVFREILKEEKDHTKEMADTNNTMMNLRTAMQREKDKVDTIKSIMKAADNEKDIKTVSKLKDMLIEELGHISKLEKALDSIEKEIAEMRRKKEKQTGNGKKFCTWGVCGPDMKEDQASLR